MRDTFETAISHPFSSKGGISHCFSCCDAASLTLIEAIFFCLSLILRCLLLPAYHNIPASEHKPDSDEY